MSSKFEIDVDELRQLVADGVKTQDIADMFGCSRATIQKRMHANGIKYDMPKLDVSKETLASLVADGLSDEEIGKRYSVAAATVKSKRERYGIYVARHVDVSEDDFKRLAISHTDKETAEILGCSKSWVEQKRAEYGIRKASPAKEPVDRSKVAMMLDAGYCKTEIAKALGYSSSTISRIGRELGYCYEHIDDNVLRRYIEDGLSDAQISDATGFSAGVIQAHRLKMGIKRNVSRLPSDDEIRRMITEEHLSDAEMAARYGVSEDTIRHRRCEAGIKKEPVSIDSDHLKQLVGDGKSDKEIADMYGFQTRTIGAYRIRNGILRDAHHHRLYDIDETELREYVARGMTNSEIADIYGCSQPIILQRRHELGIPNSRGYTECEAYVRNLLNSLGYDEGKGFVHNTRSVIAPYEMDFYVPDRRIGIEVSPTYTHASDPIPWSSIITPKQTNYHQKKSLMSLDKGINLVTLYDWYGVEQATDIIRTLLGKNERIGARKCDVVYPDKRQEQMFLRSNHLQGYVRSKYCVGLSYDEQLVCLMSFAKPRFHSDADGNVEYELLRFATSCGVSVQGGASRLLAQATRDLMPHGIISYASLDISNGNMYSKLGFEQSRITSPSYEWVNARDPKEHYSWSLILNKGVDNVLGTHFGKGANNDDLMRSLGFVRVFNSGNIVFIKR